VCSKNSEYYFEMDKKDMHILVKNILVSEKKGKPKEKPVERIPSFFSLILLFFSAFINSLCLLFQVTGQYYL